MSVYRSDAFIYHGPGRMGRETIWVECGPTDIAIRIEVCGRCGTEKNLWVKEHPAVHVPAVLGHELLGEIVEVGREVNAFGDGVGYYEGRTPPRYGVGQKVTIQPRIARYRDGLMLMRDPIENVSFRIRGGYAQYMRIPQTVIRAGGVIPVCDSIGREEGALIEPAACALESVFGTPHVYGVDENGRHLFRGGIRKEGKALIIGSGTLAMIYGALCKLEGAAEVWYVVRSDEKKSLLQKTLGTDIRVRTIADYSALEVQEKLAYEARLEAEFMELTGGSLFDDVVLAAPSLDGQRLMMHLINPDGYGVAAEFAGLRELSDRINVDAVHYRIGKIIGTSGCSTTTMQTIARWLEEGRLDLKGFVSKRHYTLADDPGEFLATKGDGLKPMLYPWE